jgi:hypothetical protein
MILALAKRFADTGGAREDALLVHPLQLSRWLEEVWASGQLVPELAGAASSDAPFLGDAGIIGALAMPPPVVTTSELLAPSGITLDDPRVWSGDRGDTQPAGVGLVSHHLMYAYLVECTGVVEVFLEVVRRLVAGETLGTLSPDGARWVGTTEELVFRDPPLFSIGGLVSEARPYSRVSRRNAYWRMFGCDLPHQIAPGTGGAGGQEWKAHVGLGVNTDFQAKWNELLRQVWLGVENGSNTSGPNPTDPSYVSFLCVAIKDMLNNRRRGGRLAREEFAYVTLASWFHLTLQSDTPIVRDLKAEATSPADRLARIAQRVGLTPAARARELFDLAEPMSSVLRAVELGMFDDPTAASGLFDITSPLGVEMRDIVNLWQSATGHRVKDRPGGAAVVPLSPQPLRLPAPGATPAPTPAAVSSTPLLAPVPVGASNGQGR